MSKEMQTRGVMVFFFQTPLIKNIRNLSDFEWDRIKNWQFDFNNISEDDYRFISKVYGDEVCIDYLRQVYDGTKVFSWNGIKYLADFRSNLVNIVNGERFTVGQPSSYRRTVWVYGQCTARGTGVEDKNTIPSIIQKKINEELPEEAIVRNRAIGCGSDLYDDIEHAKKDYQNAGDIAVFCTDLRDVPKEKFVENGILYYDCSPLFSRPHDYGEWFTDATFHTTPTGNRVIGDYIFSVLVGCGAFQKRYAIIDENSIISNKESRPVDEEQILSFLDSLDQFRKSEMRCGAIVMNCNPLTKGHLFLIESAASQVDWLFIFVVEEDKSFFRFADRIDLVKRGTTHIPNVTVLPSGRFVLSAETFPGYFYKDNNTDINVDPSTDVIIFGRYIAPKLDISIRFVGEEPLDPVTAVYNRHMKEILPRYGIEVREIRRKESDGSPISASRVRKLLKERAFDEIRKIVPDVTYQYLEKNYG